MRTRGKIQTINRGINGGFAITLSLPECQYNELVLLEPEDLNVELTKYRERRSLDANAYFHVLVSKIAGATGENNINIKNKMISEYGEYEYLDGKVITITTQIPPEAVRELEAVHWQYYSTVFKGDKPFYNYLVMRGSHTYDTKEMSRLIEGAVYEAKELGIETLTPEEIERLENSWQAKS